jgi:hypothetical protein
MEDLKIIDQALTLAVDSLNILRSKDYKVRIYQLDDQLNQLVTFLEVSRAKYIKENKDVEN